MTYLTTKKFLAAFFAVGILSMGIVGFSQNADAVTATQGRDIINYEIQTTLFPGQERLQEISIEMNDPQTTSLTKQALVDESEQIRQNFLDTTPEVSAEHEALLNDKKSLLAESIQQIPEDERKVDLPIIGVMADKYRNAVVVHIDPALFSEEKAPKIADSVRAIIGPEVDLIVEPIIPAKPQVCSQTSDCEPAQAGVQIETSFWGPCTVGFKASYDGKTGFVTAGHCGNLNDGVGQPSYFWWDHIGTVYENAYDSSTTCDCLFVDADETISDKIYNNFDVSLAGDAAYGDLVYMEGRTTKGISGIVYNTNYSYTYQGHALNNLAYVSYVSQGGDSGAPVYITIGADRLAGIHHGGNGVSFGLFSHQSNAADEMPGLTWTFS